MLPHCYICEAENLVVLIKVTLYTTCASGLTIVMVSISGVPVN